MKTPILETERLILRPIAMEDAPVLQDLFNNWNIIKNLGIQVPWPYPDDGEVDFIKSQMPQIEKGETFVWVLTHKETKALMGQVDFRLKDKDRDNRGFWLGEPHWGNGYMSEAVAAVNDFIFSELGIEEFYVLNHASNEASRRVKEKTGAEFIETVEYPHHCGENKAERWRVTKENWAKCRDTHHAQSKNKS